MILNIGSKKISIICIFYKADKPTVDILSVYSSCSGFSVEVTESRGGDVEGVLYSPVFSKENPKRLLCSLTKSSTCSIGEIFREEFNQ